MNIQKKHNLVIAKKGLVIAYIGDGKGKTTAAMGLAARASGAGLNVMILQFVKAKSHKIGERLEPGEWPLSSEIEFFNQISTPSTMGSITCQQFGVGFVGILGDKKARSAHIKEALKGLEQARIILAAAQHQVIILDEIITAVELNLLRDQDIIDLISYKPQNTHLIITGHNKFKKILAACDVVTYMKMVKHTYYKGMLAQKGIDF